MTTTAVAAAGVAVASYFYYRRGKDGPEQQDADNPGLQRSSSLYFETHQTAHQAPNTWLEALYFFAEGLRYGYGETLGKWRTADLLIGLAYLARREGERHTCADYVERGRPLGHGLSVDQCLERLEELRTVQRFMKYCLAMRERRPRMQLLKFSKLGIEEADLLSHEPRAGVLRPSYMVIRDRKLRSIVLAVRGTHSMKDVFTNLSGASKPHHVLDGQGLVMGYSHFGMLAAARWIKGQVTSELLDALANNPGYSLRVTGHSLGGGTAALLTMMLREARPEFAQVTCVALACPGCMTLELARSCSSYVTTVVHGTDIVPTISPAAADALREEVMQSSWYEEFRNDIRSSLVVRAVEGSLRSVGSATIWTARATLSACYSRGPAGIIPPGATPVGPRLEGGIATGRTPPRLPLPALPRGRRGGDGRRPDKREEEGQGSDDEDGADVDEEEGLFLIEVAREWAERGDEEASTSSAWAALRSGGGGSRRRRRGMGSGDAEAFDDGGSAPSGHHRPYDLSGDASTSAPGRGAGWWGRPWARCSAPQQAPAAEPTGYEPPDPGFEPPNPQQRGFLMRWWTQGCRASGQQVPRGFLESFERQVEEQAAAAREASRREDKGTGAGGGPGFSAPAFGGGAAAAAAQHPPLQPPPPAAAAERAAAGATAPMDVVQLHAPCSPPGVARADRPYGGSSSGHGSDGRGGALEAAAAEGSATLGPPRSMEMDDSGDDDEEDGIDGLLGRGGVAASLRDQLGRELRRVHAAVSEEEAQEAEERLQQRQEANKNSGSSSGGADASTAAGAGLRASSPSRVFSRNGSSISEAALLERRRTYPAGRILHLVPAHLVYGPDAQFEKLPASHHHLHRSPSLLVGSPPSSSSALGGAAGTMSPPSSSALGGAAGFMSPPSSASALGVAAGFTSPPLSPRNEKETTLEHPDDSWRGAGPEGGGAPPSTAGGVGAGAGGMGAPGGVGGPAAAAATPGSGPRQQGQQQRGQRVKWALLEDVPQEAYGRIRLSRTMVQDHFIPTYAAAMDSALHTMIERCVLPVHQAEAASAAAAEAAEAMAAVL